MSKIPGGYYIKARKIQNSKVMIKPPYFRDIWDYLIREANHKTRIVYGRKIKRGQLLRSFKRIINDLSWYVGYRKESYKKWQCEKSMKWLTKQQMITTMRTTRGLLITICNYEFYQNPKNYESNKGSNKKATRKQQTTDTINKNGKNEENEEKERKKEKEKTLYLDFVYLTNEQHQKLEQRFGKIGTQRRIENLNNYAHQIGARKFKSKYKSHYHTILNWDNKDRDKTKEKTLL